MTARRPLAGKAAWTRIAALRGGRELSSGLAAWGATIGSRARAAVKVLALLHAGKEASDERLGAVGSYYGLHAGHAFHVEPLRWFRPTEAQVTGGIAHFLNAGGTPRILAFLHAAEPEVVWPTEFATSRAAAEVRTPKGARIDLIVDGKAGRRSWGAVIEAKFGHDLKANPLHDYVAHAATLGLAVPKTARTKRTCAFLVVGPTATRTTVGRLASNPDWRFLAWDALLRRFERLLTGTADDPDFRQFRRTIWERTR